MIGGAEVETYQIKPGQKVQLKDGDQDEIKTGKISEEEARNEISKLQIKLVGLQEVLFAESKHKILIILQGMDTSGKDGVIRHVFEGINPQGIRVASFKAPSTEELSHDYLWRVHKQTPVNGEIVIFNRSHYEDVLVVRVHNLVAENIWRRRFDQINAFERQLAEEGTTIIKFHLHISKKEQKERLLDRLATAEKQWKFNPADLKERLLWDHYMQAYEDVLEKTSTEWAPWINVPANHKWYRDLIIARTLVESLGNLNMNFPKLEGSVEEYYQTLKSEND
jgi:PPK2 family polyphosphate:nucleotide phosphotransferase